MTYTNGGLSFVYPILWFFFCNKLKITKIKNRKLLSSLCWLHLEPFLTSPVKINEHFLFLLVSTFPCVYRAPNCILMYTFGSPTLCALRVPESYHSHPGLPLCQVSLCNRCTVNIEHSELNGCAFLFFAWCNQSIVPNPRYYWLVSNASG